MSDDENDGVWRSYEIGYGKPPASRRFAKGKSGNPRGRPKKVPTPKSTIDRSMRDAFLSATKREVSIREGGVVKKIPLLDAAFQAESVLALKGSPYALKNFLDRAERYGKDESTEIREDNDYWRNYSATYENNVLVLQKAGHQIPESWPHPDDIVFEEGCFVKFRGGDPIEASKNRALVIRFRDLFMLQAEKDRRCFCKANPGLHPPIFLSEGFATQFNAHLPKRMQLDELGFIMRTLSIQTLRKTVLEKRIREEWAELDVREARNLITPPLKSCCA